VNVDESPNLALRYGVRSIPTVKAISQGQVVGEFAGLQPEVRVREFLAQLSPPSEASLAKEKADSLLAQHAWAEAEAIYRSLEEQNQNQPPILLGLIKSLMAQGKNNEALFILNYFPASREYNNAELLRPLSEAIMKLEKNELPAETDLDTMFQRSIRLAQRGNHLAALDGLLEIMRQNKHYRSDKARQAFLGILELLGPDDPDARQYRSELAGVLF
jgi:putative thioredoxin